MHDHAPLPTLSEVVALGDLRQSLEALRGKLAAAIDACPEPRDVAPLSRRLEAVLAQLDALPALKESDDVVSAFRQPRPSPRKSGATRSHPASGGGTRKQG